MKYAQKENSMKKVLALIFISLQLSAVTCEIKSVTDIPFGAYDVFNFNDLDAQNKVVVRCKDSQAQTISVQVQLSTGNGNSYTPRSMSNGSDTLNYNLYRNSNRTKVFGDGTSGTYTVTKKLKLKANKWKRFRKKIFGQIPAQQDVEVGLYTDTVVVTIVY